MKRALIFAIVVTTICGACQSPESRLNAPPHGMPAGGTHKLQGTYVYMIDNALLADMTVSDIHFLPNRPGLNTLGRERLARLAALIEEYGGEVRMNTDIQGELLTQRIDSVRTFLAEAGVNTTVKQDVPGGRGMLASEVVLVKTREGTYQDKGSSTKAGPSLPTGSAAPSTGTK